MKAAYRSISNKHSAIVGVMKRLEAVEQTPQVKRLVRLLDDKRSELWRERCVILEAMQKEKKS
jgi:hypothetical protein